MGTPPPVTVKPMAEPLSTLDGKTIYLVNTGFVNTERLMEEFKKWFQANYPKTTIVDQRTGMSNLTAGVEEGTAGKGGCRDLRPGALKCLRARGGSPRNRDSKQT